MHLHQFNFNSTSLIQLNIICLFIPISFLPSFFVDSIQLAHFHLQKKDSKLILKIRLNTIYFIENTETK